MVHRYGWKLEVHHGIKMMYDPLKKNPTFKKIPKIKVERSRTMYYCRTNRQAVLEIESILMAFLEMLRHGFLDAPVSKILAAKKEAEQKISLIERQAKFEEKFSEGEFTALTWITKPMPRGPVYLPQDTSHDLFMRFDALKAGGA